MPRKTPRVRQDYNFFHNRSALPLHATTSAHGAQNGHRHCSDQCPLLEGGADIGHSSVEVCLFGPMPMLQSPSPLRRLAQPAMSQAVICPTGCFAKTLSSPLAKNISLSPSGKSNLRLATSRLDKRGVRVVTNVGCGMRWTRQRRKTSGANADGEVVWS